MMIKRVISTVFTGVITAAFAASLALTASAAGAAVGVTGEYDVYQLNGVNPDDADVKPIVSLSQIELPIDVAKENPVVQVNLSVSNAEYKYAVTGFHVSYDERLTPVTNRVGRAADRGEAAKYLLNTQQTFGTHGIFVTTGGDENIGTDDVLWQFHFRLPEDVQVGDVFPVEILYENGDLFKNKEDDSESYEMQAWVFTHGIEQGYIKITGEQAAETPVETPVESRTITGVKGDPNHDGKINSSDASMVLDAYSQIQTGKLTDIEEEQFVTEDINEDRKIDSSDATLILGYYSYCSIGGTLSFDDFLAQ